MAKRKSDTESGQDKGRVRVLLVEMEGNNDSLQQSIKALTQAMSRPTATGQPSLAVPPAPSAPPTPDSGYLSEEEDTFDAIVDEESGEAESGNEARKRRGEGPKRDRNLGITLNPSLDLKPVGKDSLASFIESKNPTNQQEEIAAFVYYLKEVAGADVCTIDDVFTCFKKTGKKIPKDLRQSIRNTEKNQGYVTGDLQNLNIATAGQNFIEHDLPKGS